MRRKQRGGAAGQPQRNGKRRALTPKEVEAIWQQLVNDFFERPENYRKQTDRDVIEGVIDRISLAVVRGDHILNLSGFVKAVKRRVAIDLYRRRCHQPVSLTSLEQEPTVAGDCERVDLADLVREALRQLAAISRLALHIVLLHADGRSFQDIARALGMSGERVRDEVRRALAKLRRAREFRWMTS